MTAPQIRDSEFVAPSPSGPTSGGAAILLCSKCGGKRSKRSMSGLCFRCAMEARKPAPRFCKDCNKRLSRQAKTGYCLPCVQSKPWFRERRIEAMRRIFADPAHLEKMRKVVARNHAKARLRPEFAQWLHDNGKRLAAILQSPEVRAKTQSPEIRAKSAKAQSERKMGWCPPDFRDEYHRLIRSKRMHSSEARKIILVKAADCLREQRAIEHSDWDSVVSHMRRVTAVIRMDNGNYRVGTAELTPGQLLERTELRGYELPRWAA